VIRLLPSLLLAALASLALAVPASAFSGAYVRGSNVSATYAAKHLLVRIACPPGTRSTPREGDFSFCTGSARFFHRGRLVASGPFSVRTYDSHIEKMRVRSAAKPLFRPGRRPTVSYVVRSHDGQGQWATNRGTFTVYNPFKR
jgi:hypothetical protein